MRSIELSRTYKKQYKRLKHSGANMNLLNHTIMALATNNLPELKRLGDHPLKGKLGAYREVHVGQHSSNWVVQYQILEDDTLLLLIQTGTHSTILGL
jgi:mRNA interferase YafQ